MGVEFDENKPIDLNYQPKKKGLASFLIKLGLAKDDAGAQKVMLAIIVICFALSVYFLFK